MNSTSKERPTWRDYSLHRRKKLVSKGIGIESVSIQLNDHNAINVPGWFVTDLYLSRSGESYSILSDRCIYTRPQTEDVFIVIAREFDEEYVPLFGKRGRRKKQTIFERLENEKDIASVRYYHERVFSTDEKTYEDYDTPWENDRDDEKQNALQFTFRNVYGDLIIAIGKSDLLLRMARNAARESRTATELAHRIRLIGVPFDPVHDLSVNSNDYPEKGRIVLVRGKYNDEPIRAVYNGESWKNDNGEPLSICPRYWQYERKFST